MGQRGRRRAGETKCWRATATMNPVRAGMVRHPQDYRWSSDPANGEGKVGRAR
ncbi:MAG TPA: hypothetical protein VE735_06040 [Gammaproteobacteria bacterium]|nr:hypothetical protein [Gammaproteobacteria bacterium]